MSDVSTELSILMFLQENIRQDWLNPLMVFYSAIGKDGAIWGIIIAFMIVFQKTRIIGIIAAISFAITGAIALIAKEIFMRPRPFMAFNELVHLGKNPTSGSFPSGHTAMAFSLAFVILKSEYKKIRWILLVLACLMGFSRMYVGAHYPTDVLGGIMCALIGSYLAILWSKRIKFLQKFFKDDKNDRQ